MPDSSTAINWRVTGGSRVLLHPIYLKYSVQTYETIDAGAVKTDIKAALASNDSADLVAFLVSLLRVKALLA
jgi:hypothetical protein